jgi:hypothetical protein
MSDKKEILKDYETFIGDGVGWANEITETGHQLFSSSFITTTFLPDISIFSSGSISIIFLS